MDTTVERKPLPLPDGRDEVLLHSCYLLRDTNRHLSSGSGMQTFAGVCSWPIV